jgi:hypothetical protein
MTLQISSEEGRAAGSNWRHALMAASISCGHSSGTLHAPASHPHISAGSTAREHMQRPALLVCWQ